MKSSAGKKKKEPIGFKKLVSGFFILLVVAGVLLAVLEQWKPDLVAYKPIGSAVVVKTKGLLKHLALQVYTPPPRSELLEGEVLICRSVTLDADHNPLAILDNRAVAIGETYRGVKVVDITSGYVLVDIQGKRERLVVGGSLTIPNP